MNTFKHTTCLLIACSISCIAINDATAQEAPALDQSGAACDAKYKLPQTWRRHAAITNCVLSDPRAGQYSSADMTYIQRRMQLDTRMRTNSGAGFADAWQEERAWRYSQLAQIRERNEAAAAQAQQNQALVNAVEGVPLAQATWANHFRVMGTMARPYHPRMYQTHY